MLCYLNLRLNVKDAEKKDKFMPRYPVGAKRTLFSNDFYPAIDQPNVQINTVGIKGIYEKGIINSDNSSTEVDTIIYATGFISNPFLYDMTVIGRSSKELWKEDKGAHAYLGVATRGFPNLFFLYGPNTNVGHTSILLFLEEQTKFVLRAMQHVKSNYHKAIEVKRAVEDTFNDEIDKVSKELSFTKIKTSWYLFNERLVNNWIGSFSEYKDSLCAINFSKEFELHGEDSEGYSMLVNCGTGPNDGERGNSSFGMMFGMLIMIPTYAIIMSIWTGRLVLTIAFGW